MGSGISNIIAINLDRANSFYLSGECISGTVNLNIIEGKLEADKIYITLTGEIGDTTIRTVSTSGGQTSRQTEHLHIPFLFNKVICSQPLPGQNQLLYDQGQYSWPFQILLPEYLPPTLNRIQSYPHVRYYLQVVIDKRWYKSNRREKRSITIFPRVNLLQNPPCLVPTIFGNQNRKDINLKGTLNKCGYVPGELIIVTLEIHNPRSTLIQQIDLSMLQSYRIERNSCEFTLFETILPRIINLKDQQIRETFSIKIPTISLAPSYQFQGGIRAVANVHLHYFLKFTVRVEGLFTNFHIDVPIIIGTEPNPDPHQQEISNPLITTYSSNPDQSMIVDYDPPPSYDSVVQNIK